MSAEKEAWVKEREAWIKSEETRLKEEEARLSKLQAPMMTLVAKIKDREEALKKGTTRAYTIIIERGLGRQKVQTVKWSA